MQSPDRMSSGAHVRRESSPALFSIFADSCRQGVDGSLPGRREASRGWLSVMEIGMAAMD
jgi:hypothetical protein